MALKDNVVIGMCTANRSKPTIWECLKSIESSWFDWHLVISSEGTEASEIANEFLYESSLSRSHNINETPLWCFKNHHKLLEILVAEWKEYILLLQDDFLYHFSFFERLEEANLSEEFGYYNLHTYRVYQNAIKQSWRNRVNIWRSTAFSVSYFMRTETVKKIMEHEFYRNHLWSYQKNQQVDACITEVCRILNLPMYVHNPSLSIHIGHNCSTLNHWHIEDNNFRSFPVKCE